MGRGKITENGVKYVHSTRSTPFNSVYILHVTRETCFLCVNCFKCRP